jgi:hypothetical protein
MQSLSVEYDDFMRHRQDKQKLDKLIEKNIEKSALAAPTWIRDVFTERETYKKNMYYYSNIGNHTARHWLITSNSNSCARNQNKII